MTPLFDRCHIFHIGAGGSRKKDQGLGCNCSENILLLSRYYHDVLDGRYRNYDLEHWKVRNKDKEAYKKEPRSYWHKIAFGACFGYGREIRFAIRHHEERMQGKVECTKIKK